MRARPEEAAPALHCTTKLLGLGSAKSNEALHASGVIDLVPELCEEHKVLYYSLAAHGMRMYRTDML